MGMKMNTADPKVNGCRGCVLLFLSVLVFNMTAVVNGADYGPQVARLLWQDRDKGALRWGSVHAGQKWVVTAADVKGFPQLDTEKQSLTQMRQVDGLLLMGVRDNDQGRFQSGWIAVDTGVRKEAHGDHFHWRFMGAPAVKGSRLDAEQGNPAHLYVYNNIFYMAQDAKGGFTQLTPKDLAARPAQYSSSFRSGGGGHITLAAVDNTVSYATWIDAEGPNTGRVDVVSLRQPAGSPPAYSLTLPSGGIHGATTNSGRVFFAPADGICWVDADPGLRQTAETVKVHHISLGTPDGAEQPARTGAFVNQRNWVMFTVNGGAEQSALCLLDAKAPQPQVVKLAIPVAAGLALTSPEVVLASGGKRYAFLFHDRQSADAQEQEQLTIVDLDPNGDRNFADARIAQTIPVGASKVDGHHGHHAVSFDSEGRLACFTNPGDGTIWVMSLRDLTIRAKSIVGGTPEAIIAIGAPEHHH